MELPHDAGATENIKVKVLIKGEEHAPEVRKARVCAVEERGKEEKGGVGGEGGSREGRQGEAKEGL